MNKERQPPGFMLYREPAIMLELMPSEDLENAVRSACKYFLHGKKTEVNGIGGEVANLLFDSIDRDRQKYTEVCERNAIIAQDRERKRKEQRERDKELDELSQIGDEEEELPFE